MHPEKSTEQAQREGNARVEREEIYRGRTITVCRDIYEVEDRKKHWDVVVHPGAAVLIPVLPNKEILLVKQWRRAINEITLEFPAGTLEPGEEPLVCAQRELREETGYQAQRLIPMGGFYSAPGFCTEYLHLYLALELEQAPLVSDDEDEEIDLISASFAQVAEMIEKHQIKDAKTIAGFYRYGHWLAKEKV